MRRNGENRENVGEASHKASSVLRHDGGQPVLASTDQARLFSIRRTWWVAVYPVSVWVGVVYLGEHYVTDVILGVVYAATTYAIVSWVFRSSRRRGASRLSAVGPADSLTPIPVEDLTAVSTGRGPPSAVRRARSADAVTADTGS